MGAHPDDLHAFLLSLQGWQTYVAIVVFSLVLMAIIGFVIEKIKSSKGKIEFAFFHDTLEVISAAKASGITDLSVTFRGEKIGSLYRSNILMTPVQERDLDYQNWALPSSLQINMKDNERILALTPDLRTGLEVDSPDGQKAIHIAFSTMRPDEAIRLEILHSDRSQMFLSGTVAGEAVKSVDMGELSMQGDAKDTIYPICGILVLSFATDYIENIVKKHEYFGGELNTFRIFFIILLLLLLVRLMSLFLRTNKKGRLLRRLKKTL